jgi:hypothetical protein
VSEHREEADRRERQAEAAERRARIAEQEAQRERAEAQLRQEKAALHEQGMADHELIGDHEREHFAGTSAVPDSATGGGAATHADNGVGAGDGANSDLGAVRADEGRERTTAYAEGRRSAEDPARLEEFRAGRRDELE